LFLSNVKDKQLLENNNSLNLKSNQKGLFGTNNKDNEDEDEDDK
jgi:hypothetical protein